MTGNCFSVNDGVLALSRGWGDVYRWQRPGQYVEFSGDGDGYYVLRATVDKSNTTLETNEDDNASYALIKVVGHHVELLERGQGQSPFDPHKEVFKGFGPASQDPYGGEVPAQPEASAPRAAPAAAPHVTGVRLRGRALRFTLNAPARVRVVVRRRGRVVLRRTLRASAGTNYVALRGLRRGVRYRVAVSAGP